MTSKIRLLVVAAVLATVATAASIPAQAVSSSGGDFMRVTKVVVNKLGGVSVSGVVSCGGAYEELMDGQLRYQDENEYWWPIPAPTLGQLVLLQANNDNYTVYQPAGRKTMVTVEHRSSRMSPCYSTATTGPGGWTIPCTQDGCRWESWAPTFDYAANGKFAPSLLSVTAHSDDILVMILKLGGDPEDPLDWETYWSPREGFVTTPDTIIKAVTYRR